MAYFNTFESQQTAEFRTKAAKYLAGQWSCEVPTVCTVYWDIAAWVTWIDNHGIWKD